MSKKGTKHSGPRIWITGYEARLIAEELSLSIRNRQQHNDARLRLVKIVENLKVRMEAASIEAKAKIRWRTKVFR